uniref:MS127, putative ferredoxin reductase n=1 Tax=Microscilla sp. PRE1 TaxID=155537 RepID=Q93PA4_9BACT|nr:FAD-dependent oxidoreductase [Microscilla sp. PRE1]AAK62849.1 MS127, putative ferredoxin reductase [Microscilla sp. PRE1]
MSQLDKTCVIIGASHAGVNCAFALRKEGWQGGIVLYDADPSLPYHRPPLSKAYLTSDAGIEKYLLKSAESYEKDNITLRLGIQVSAIDRTHKILTLNDGNTRSYDKLVIATGARPIIPPTKGIKTAKNLYPLRNAADVQNIRQALESNENKRVVIVGAGYIGLEIAASLKNRGAQVTVLEREDRVLARVTAPEMSAYFQQLHVSQGVEIVTNKNVVSIAPRNGFNTITCSDGTQYDADVIVMGVGIRVNLELAEDAGLNISNGICVNAAGQTNDEDIYAIGDCTLHYNPHYNRHIRLESVQNAVDQAKVTAAAICGKEVAYNAIPWFWSDQYDVKLQIVGLSSGYNELLIRREDDGRKFSSWYFKDDELLAVDAINNAKAYVIATKFIKERRKVDKIKLTDASVALSPLNLSAESHD